MKTFYAEKISSYHDTMDNTFSSFCSTVEEFKSKCGDKVFYIVWVGDCYKFSDRKVLNNTNYARVFDPSGNIVPSYVDNVLSNIKMMSRVRKALKSIYGFNITQTIPTLMVPNDFRRLRGIQRPLQYEIDRLILILSYKMWNEYFTDEDRSSYNKNIKSLENIAAFIKESCI